VSTNQGISKFDPRKRLSKITITIMASTEHFNMGAGIKTQSGEIYFGGWMDLIILYLLH
jgi:cytidine deaminase